MSNGQSLAERLPRILVEIEDMKAPWDVRDPRRFAKHKMYYAAVAALENGMRTAGEIVEAYKALRDADSADGKP